jgi:hypothetical protein
MSINRIGTANMYDSTINNLGSRQSSLVDLMEKTTAGKRVLRASDDPWPPPRPSVRARASPAPKMTSVCSVPSAM